MTEYWKYSIDTPHCEKGLGSMNLSGNCIRVGIHCPNFFIVNFELVKDAVFLQIVAMASQFNEYMGREYAHED